MTKAKAKPAGTGIDLSDVDDETQYAVTLNRPIQVGSSWARPGQTPVMKGKIIKENVDAIANFTEA